MKYSAKLVISLLSCVSLALAVVYVYYLYIPTSDVKSSVVRTAAQRVLFSQLWSKVSGGYWENEMLTQYRNVESLTLQERLDFYLILIAYCDLSYSRATLFYEIAEPDIVMLHRYLVEYKKTEKFASSSVQEKVAINDWIEALANY